MKEREESSEESEENVFMRIISVFNICETKRKKKLIIWINKLWIIYLNF